MPASILTNVANQIAAQHGVTSVMNLSGTVGGFVVEAPKATAQALRNNRNVRSVVPDIRLWAMSEIGWALPRISHRNRVTSGPYNDRGLTGAGVRIYVVDNGVRANHHEVQGRVNAFFDIFDLLDQDYDNTCRSIPPSTFRPTPLAHGTAVASAAAGTTLGSARHATIMDARVMDCSGKARLSWLLDGLNAINNAERNRAEFSIVNLSLGSDEWQQDGYAAMGFDSAKGLLRNAIDALPDNVLAVAAAGNRDRSASEILPAALDEVLTVGGSNRNDERFRYFVSNGGNCGSIPCPVPYKTDDDGYYRGSNYGEAVDIFAPGRNVIVAHAENDSATAEHTGTSFSAPFTAGVAAIYAEHLGLEHTNGDQVRNRLLQNATQGKLSGIGDSPNRLLYNEPEPNEAPPGIPDCPWQDENDNWIICP